MRWTRPADGIEVPRWQSQNNHERGRRPNAGYHDRAGYRQERIPGARCRSAGPGGAEEAAGARQGLEFFANLPRCLRGLEACGGAHCWARELIRLGHDARWSALAARRGVNGLRERRPFNVVVAAGANKPARILRAMLSRGEAIGRPPELRPLERVHELRGAIFDVMTGSVRPRPAEPVLVHELRARCHDGARLGPRTDHGGRSGPARVRGSHQGQRFERRTHRPNGSQQPSPRQNLGKKPCRAGGGHGWTTRGMG